MTKDMLEKKTIGQIEKMAERALKDSVNSRLRFISVLFFLEKTKRYRENQQFKDETFENYILIKYLLPYSRYYQERLAYIKTPKEIETYGIGNVVKVNRQCAAMDVPKVFNELKTRAKGNVLTQPEIDTVIHKYARPQIDNKQPYTYTQLENMYEKKCEENKQLTKEIAEMQDREEKLKGALLILREEEAA